MKNFILIVLGTILMSEHAFGNLCYTIDYMQYSEALLLKKTMELQNAEKVEATSEFKTYHKLHTGLLKTALQSQAIGEFDEFTNEVNLCIKNSRYNLSPNELSKAIIEKFESSPILRQTLIQSIGQKQYDIFIQDLKNVETTRHLLRAFTAGIGIGGPSTLFFFIAILKEARIAIIAGLGTVMVGSAAYGIKKLYDNFKMDIWVPLLNFKDREKIDQQASEQALAVARDFVQKTLGAKSISQP